MSAPLGSTLAAPDAVLRLLDAAGDRDVNNVSTYLALKVWSSPPPRNAQVAWTEFQARFTSAPSARDRCATMSALLHSDATPQWVRETIVAACLTASGQIADFKGDLATTTDATASAKAEAPVLAPTPGREEPEVAVSAATAAAAATATAPPASLVSLIEWNDVAADDLFDEKTPNVASFSEKGTSAAPSKAVTAADMAAADATTAAAAAAAAATASTATLRPLGCASESDAKLHQSELQALLRVFTPVRSDLQMGGVARVALLLRRKLRALPPLSTAQQHDVVEAAAEAVAHELSAAVLYAFEAFSTPLTIESLVREFAMACIAPMGRSLADPVHIQQHPSRSPKRALPFLAHMGATIEAAVFLRDLGDDVVDWPTHYVPWLVRWRSEFTLDDRFVRFIDELPSLDALSAYVFRERALAMEPRYHPVQTQPPAPDRCRRTHRRHRNARTRASRSSNSTHAHSSSSSSSSRRHRRRRWRRAAVNPTRFTLRVRLSRARARPVHTHQTHTQCHAKRRGCTQRCTRRAQTRDRLWWASTR